MLSSVSVMDWSCWSYFFFTLLLWQWHVHESRSDQTFGTRSGLRATAGVGVVPRAGGSWPPDTTFQRFASLRQLGAEVVTNHQESRGNLTSEVIERFKTLNFPPEDAVAGSMTNKGNDYFKNLAKTLKEIFPQLFAKPYSNEDYESMESFTKEIFGDEFDTSKIHEPAEPDTLLDAPNICQLWKTTAFKKNYWRLLAQSITSPLWRLRREVSKRMGFKTYLGSETVLHIYLGCCLQKEIDPAGQSTWCDAFSSYNLKLLEYLEDRFYYRACTGAEKEILKDLDIHMPCRLYQAIIPQLSRVEHKRQHPSGFFYFTDEKTLLLLLNGLGGLKEATINDFNSADERTFRTSKLVPLGANNLLIVIYRCSADEDLKIVFSLNGKLLKLPKQTNNFMPLKQFRHDLESFAFTKMECKEDYCKDIDKTEEDIIKVFDST